MIDWYKCLIRTGRPSDSCFVRRSIEEGQHYFVILILFSVKSIGGALLFQPKAFYMGFKIIVSRRDTEISKSCSKLYKNLNCLALIFTKI